MALDVDDYDDLAEELKASKAKLRELEDRPFYKLPPGES